jgi:hypothetical protein
MGKATIYRVEKKAEKVEVIGYEELCRRLANLEAKRQKERSHGNPNANAPDDNRAD